MLSFMQFLDSLSLCWVYTFAALKETIVAWNNTDKTATSQVQLFNVVTLLETEVFERSMALMHWDII